MSPPDEPGIAAWTRARQPLLGRIFLAIAALVIALDLALVLALGADSISLRTWIATKAHPTLIAAGVLATVGASWLVRGDWRLVMFAGLAGGHLFIHW